MAACPTIIHTQGNDQRTAGRGRSRETIAASSAINPAAIFQAT
jgi:hypothetical protein